MRNREWLLPTEIWQGGLRRLRLTFANQHPDASLPGDKSFCHFQNPLKALDGPERYQAGGGRDVFRSVRQDLYVCQMQWPHYFAQEGRFLLIPLDQLHGERRRPYLWWNPR